MKASDARFRISGMDFFHSRSEIYHLTYDKVSVSSGRFGPRSEKIGACTYPQNPYTLRIQKKGMVWVPEPPLFFRIPGVQIFFSLPLSFPAIPGDSSLQFPFPTFGDEFFFVPFPFTDSISDGEGQLQLFLLFGWDLDWGYVLKSHFCSQYTFSVRMYSSCIAKRLLGERKVNGGFYSSCPLRNETYMSS